jgi:hypothetical protein
MPGGMESRRISGMKNREKSRYGDPLLALDLENHSETRRRAATAMFAVPDVRREQINRSIGTWKNFLKFRVSL